ncbi:uncharacterized protein pxb isoform X2 [Bemisia tabaci]|uniref:uncharacterized protein pxb isoform X2 n=1 Tax=Bemisia tabaci TaxID=7038 RepID=UPI0008F99E5D|nr:PREDICTED: uncharacterized protein LOC109032410 isoform X2 [Bemisia tabaci]
MEGGPEYDCDCPGPPPIFHLPPPPRPPRPPFLGPHESDCSDLAEDVCDVMPVIDSEYHSSPGFPSVAIILVCAGILLGTLLIILALGWKHKKRMQKFLPCKSSPQNRCDVTHGAGVIYEDLSNIRARTLPQPPTLEMLDVKNHLMYSATTGYPIISHHSPLYLYHPPRSSMPVPEPVPESFYSQDLFNPVYEELSNGSGHGDSCTDSEEAPQATHSEDEFAEDELSLGEQLPVSNTLRRNQRHDSSRTGSLRESCRNSPCCNIHSTDVTLPDKNYYIDHSHHGHRHRNHYHNPNMSLPLGSRHKRRSKPVETVSRSNKNIADNIIGNGRYDVENNKDVDYDKKMITVVIKV